MWLSLLPTTSVRQIPLVTVCKLRVVLRAGAWQLAEQRAGSVFPSPCPLLWRVFTWWSQTAAIQACSIRRTCTSDGCWGRNQPLLLLFRQAGCAMLVGDSHFGGGWVSGGRIENH